VATSFHFSYTRYLENRLREEFGFEGTPIRMHVRARRKTASEDEKGRTSRRPSRTSRRPSRTPRRRKNS
jgi:hypothetical protein